MAKQFWARVDTSGGPDACWPWQGARLPRGYGKMTGAGYAHRIAWELENGPVPAGMYVCHHCDNPPCCNPAHLFTGDAAANNADMDAKGRSGRGTFQRALTHCARGHPYSPENTRVRNGHRACITCVNAASRRHYLRNRDALCAKAKAVFRARMRSDPEGTRRASRESMQRHRDRAREAASHSRPPSQPRRQPAD